MSWPAPGNKPYERSRYRVDFNTHSAAERDAAKAKHSAEPPSQPVRYIYAEGRRYRVHSADAVVNTNGEFPGLRGDMVRPSREIAQYTRSRVKGQVAE